MGEPSSDFAQHGWVTSWGGTHEIKLGVSPPPPGARAILPERYGIPLFELLVVDPAYLFISWEITPGQIARAQNEMGNKAFTERRLSLRIVDGLQPREPVLTRELYGEQGRWFLQHGLAGKRIAAELGYTVGDAFHRLQGTGPLSLPRDFTIEPRHFDELTVRYGRGDTGELTLERIDTHKDAAWPDVSLPEPARMGVGGYLPLGGSSLPGAVLRAKEDRDD